MQKMYTRQISPCQDSSWQPGIRLDLQDPEQRGRHVCRGERYRGDTKGKITSPKDSGLYSAALYENQWKKVEMYVCHFLASTHLARFMCPKLGQRRIRNLRWEELRWRKILPLYFHRQLLTDWQCLISTPMVINVQIRLKAPVNCSWVKHDKIFCFFDSSWSSDMCKLCFRLIKPRLSAHKIV